MSIQGQWQYGISISKIVQKQIYFYFNNIYAPTSKIIQL